jgi:hypothetical protein
MLRAMSDGHQLLSTFCVQGGLLARNIALLFTLQTPGPADRSPTTLPHLVGKPTHAPIAVTWMRSARLDVLSTLPNRMYAMPQNHRLVWQQLSTPVASRAGRVSESTVACVDAPNLGHQQLTLTCRTPSLVSKLTVACVDAANLGHQQRNLTCQTVGHDPCRLVRSGLHDLGTLEKSLGYHRGLV